MRVIVACGGTGGHISPALAVIEVLEDRESDVEILCIGSKNGMENIIIPKTGLCFESINTGKLRRYHKNIFLDVFNPFTLFKNISDILKVIRGIFESVKKIKSFKPNVIFLKGGFVSVPVGIAAKILKVPFVLHESDSIPGLANRILARYAASICVSFPGDILMKKYPKKSVLTGNPIRRELTEGDRDKAEEVFELNKNKKTILVIGGSQGSMNLNRLVEGALEDILFKYQLIHITGDRDYDWIDFRARKLNKELKGKYKYYNFISSNLKEAYAISDLIISRAGSNVLNEISAIKKPSILIPLPSSTGNHQFENAKIFSREGAAYVMKENEITSGDLMNQIRFIMEDKKERDLMSKKVADYYKRDAADLITEEILNNKIDLEKKEDAKKNKKV